MFSKTVFLESYDKWTADSLLFQNFCVVAESDFAQIFYPTEQRHSVVAVRFARAKAELEVLFVQRKEDAICVRDNSITLNPEDCKLTSHS